MLVLLALAPVLAAALPGESEDEQEPVAFLVTTDLGSLPRVNLELEAPMTSWGSALVWMGYPLLVSVPLGTGGRTAGPQVAAGWRTFMFGRGPWGPFVDGRLQLQSYFPRTREEPSPIIIPGAGLTLGLNARLWRVVLSPGVSLFFIPDPTASAPLLPGLRLALGAWY